MQAQLISRLSHDNINNNVRLQFSHLSISWPKEEDFVRTYPKQIRKKRVMKKRQDQPQDGVIDKRELEILKAVAQARYGHSESFRPVNEFDARQRNFRGKPSRFKTEAMTKSSNKSSGSSIGSSAGSSWDFGQSLWDSYEIVTVSKKLETGLALDSQLSEMDIGPGRVRRKRKESKNSLRNLFIQTSSRRFNEAKIPPDNDRL